MVQKRKSLRGTDTEAEVLWLSRRRCSICSGIDNNFERQKGQIAHLNKNRSDNRLENLVFLCFDHHDEFDSKTSQSKNFTRKEIIRYRDALYESYKGSNLLNSNSGKSDLTKVRTGLYARKSGMDTGANVSIFKTRTNWDGRPVYQILGQSFHGISRDFGPNMGFLSFEVVNPKKQVIEFHDDKYSAMLGFIGDSLLLEEENEFGYFGAGAFFQGEYERVNSPFRSLRWWLRSVWVSHIKGGDWPNW